MAIEEFTTATLSGASTLAPEISPATLAYKSRHMTISYLGADMPMLRLLGRWLGRAGFVVGTRVRVDVSPRRLVVEAIAPEEPPHCADVNCPHEATRVGHRGHRPRTYDRPVEAG